MIVENARVYGVSCRAGGSAPLSDYSRRLGAASLRGTGLENMPGCVRLNSAEKASMKRSIFCASPAVPREVRGRGGSEL
jgi:hypothetical protein